LHSLACTVSQRYLSNASKAKLGTMRLKLHTPTLPNDETFLTIAEYAMRFKKSKPTLWRERRDRTGPPFIVDNGKILYPLSLALQHMADKVVVGHKAF
jgi:hypothetical protein